MQGLFGMQQPQQQANLLGNVFQSQAQSRQQGRNRLLGEALQIGLSQDPIRTGFAAVGGLLGQATGRAMGRITPEEAQQQKAAMIRRRIDERGINLAEDPYGFMMAGAEAAQESGDMQTTMAFLQRAQQYAPEQEAIDRAVIDQQIPLLSENYNSIVSSNIPISEQDQALSQLDVQLSRLPSTKRTEALRERVQSRLQMVRSQEGSVMVTPGTAEFDSMQRQLQQYGSSMPTDQGAIEVKVDPLGRPVNFETNSGGITVEALSPAQEEILSETASTRDRLLEKRDLLLESARIASDIYEGGESANLGPVGFISRIGDGIIQQSRAAAEKFNVSLSPSNYNFGGFKDDAMKSVETRSAVLAYAFSIAKADNEGRVTTPDVQMALDQIAGSSGSISQVKAGVATRLGNSIQGLDDVILARQNDFNSIEGLSAPTTVSDFMRENPDRYNRELLENLGVLESGAQNGASGQMDFSNPSQISDEQLRSLSTRNDLTEEQLKVLADEWDRRGL